MAGLGAKFPVVNTPLNAVRRRKNRASVGPPLGLALRYHCLLRLPRAAGGRCGRRLGRVSRVCSRPWPSCRRASAHQTLVPSLPVTCHTCMPAAPTPACLAGQPNPCGSGCCLHFPHPHLLVAQMRTCEPRRRGGVRPAAPRVRLPGAASKPAPLLPHYLCRVSFLSVPLPPAPTRFAALTHLCYSSRCDSPAVSLIARCVAAGALRPPAHSPVLPPLHSPLFTKTSEPVTVTLMTAQGFRGSPLPALKVGKSVRAASARRCIWRRLEGAALNPHGAILHHMVLQ